MASAAAAERNQGDDKESRSSDLSPLSIHRLIALHSHERLLVHPLLWTDRHLTLLGCHIHHRGEAGGVDGLKVVNGPPTPPESQDGDSAPSPSSDQSSVPDTRVADFLTMVDVICDFLKQAGCSVKIDKRHTRFYFRGRSRDIIEYWHFDTTTPGPNSERVTFACFDVHDMWALRRKYLFPLRDRLDRENPPLIRRYLKLMKRHTPADPTKDPYLVAVVIALAQQQRLLWRQMCGAKRGPKLHSPDGYTVRLLFAGVPTPETSSRL
ncbi:uncharacterized protein THITE_2106449 [Thermothielavioides terrestris NRRL 8126]|uniref:Uncharacterized protein n=1 Tax=Thermothielavioides terrestris (strain ATCC 38088 / NRRL 8126) TaxID=578455 RepID=G2QXN9_THETT|nr:uncharacterized protein THITE_2106449 [Thermothielavioides terrestris NRRL 8126]AEO62357.1 hypothetical protein THITE_2106449 [Thermothielavioides terrestris NRRL 8126]